MNHRDYKQFYSGGYYHVFNRGNQKQNIFLDDQDKQIFLDRLYEYLFPDSKTVFNVKPVRGQYKRKAMPVGSFDLLAFCLMPNHFHFLIKQNLETSVVKLISKLSTTYSKYFNKKYNKVGHLFQDKFKSVEVKNDSHLLWVSSYIHNNPVIAGITLKPEEYKWSSYGQHVFANTEGFCNTGIVLDLSNGRSNYKKFVEQAKDKTTSLKAIKNLLLD